MMMFTFWLIASVILVVICRLDEFKNLDDDDDDDDDDDVWQISQLMDRFEQQFENLDVQSQVMEDTMCASSTLTTPQNQVDALMLEVADEAGSVYQ